MTKVLGEILINVNLAAVWEVLADLAAVCEWNPTISNSYYISEAREGVGASRHCDFPDGGYVKESATHWEVEKLVRLHIYEGTVPFDNYFGTYSLVPDGDATLVGLSLKFDVQPISSSDPDRVEQRIRDRFIPSVLDGLKRHLENRPLK